MKQREINQLKAETNAKRLEQNATLAETILKEALIELGFNFQFQKPIHSKSTCYIADFYFPHQHLVVELDGSAHKGREEYDAKRTANIKKYHGYHVLRFKNKAVFADVIKVINKIQDWQPTYKKPKTKKTVPKKPINKKPTKKHIKDPLAEKRARIMAKVFATEIVKEKPYFN